MIEQLFSLLNREIFCWELIFIGSLNKERYEYEAKNSDNNNYNYNNDEDIELALDVVDKDLLVDTLGIDPEICHKCRAIWKKMQKRRLGRGCNENSD